MTKYRAIHITDKSVTVINFDNIEQADDYDMDMMNDPSVNALTVGEIDGKVYTVVYWHGEPKFEGLKVI